MLDNLLSYVIAEPVLVSTAVGTALFCLLFGWLLKGVGARKREAELKQAVLDAKGSIPHFETSVRSREQQISRLELEIDSLRQHANDLDKQLGQKDSELRGQARELRVLSTELSAAKSVAGDNGMLLDTVDYAGGAAAEPDAEMLSRVEKAEALYDSLRDTLAEREDRIAALEQQLATADEQMPSTSSSAAEPDHGLIQVLEDRVAAQEATIARLENQLSELRHDRDLLSGLVQSRAKNQPVLETAGDELRARVTELEHELELKSQVIENREGTMKRLLDELELTGQDRKDQQEEIAECISQLQDCEAQRAALETRIEQLEGQLKVAQTTSPEVEALQQKLRDVEALLEQSESWLDKFKVAAANRSEELGAVTAERDALQTRLAAVTASSVTDR